MGTKVFYAWKNKHDKSKDYGICDEDKYDDILFFMSSKHKTFHSSIVFKFDSYDEFYVKFLEYEHKNHNNDFLDNDSYSLRVKTIYEMCNIMTDRMTIKIVLNSNELNLKNDISVIVTYDIYDYIQDVRIYNQDRENIKSFCEYYLSRIKITSISSICNILRLRYWDDNIYVNRESYDINLDNKDAIINTITKFGELIFPRLLEMDEDKKFGHKLGGKYISTPSLVDDYNAYQHHKIWLEEEQKRKKEKQKRKKEEQKRKKLRQEYIKAHTNNTFSYNIYTSSITESYYESIIDYENNSYVDRKDIITNEYLDDLYKI